MSLDGASPMLSVAYRGFRDAVTRQEESRLTGDPIQAFIPTAESIYWAATIDEQIRAWSGYENATAAIAGGKLIPGMRYVRNLKTHQLPLTLKRVEGAMFPITFPMVFNEVVWLSADTLPEPSKTTRYTGVQRDSFERHFAGRPVHHTLQELDAWMQAVRDVPGSPLAS